MASGPPMVTSGPPGSKL